MAATQSTWKRVVADIETDGLVDALTRVHSLVIRDRDTREVLSCADQPGYVPITEGLRVLQSAERVYFHNGIDFDIPALKKVYPSFTIREEVIRDTLTMARHRWAHVKDSDYQRARRGKLPGRLIGSHSLKAWGYRLGIHKGDFGESTDWAVWTPEMQTYCEGDTAVGLALVEAINGAGVEVGAIETEHELAWYLAAQRRNGVVFNHAAAVDLYARLSARRMVLADELREAFGSWLARGAVFTPKKDNKKMGYTAGASLTKLVLTEFNPTSREHIANRLAHLYGWKPTEFTAGGKPELNESTLKGLDYAPCVLLREYLTLDKRIGQLAEGKQGWLNAATLDGTNGGKLTGAYHIHGSVNQSGCVTHRATHSYPNLAQVPKASDKVPFGKDCRRLFTVPKGWQLMGADASGLELRCLAHYMTPYDDGAYTRVILEGRNEDGTDIHSVNRNALALSGIVVTRDAAKVFIYAFLYGAGDAKLGSIVLPLGTEEERAALGKKLRAAFVKGVPAMGYLTDAVRDKAKSLSYLTLIDGRRAYVRSEHAALNTLLQGTGAVICKRWIVEFNRRMRAQFGEQGWNGTWAANLWIHDEIQVAVRDDIAAEVPAITIAAIEAMTNHFAFRCPLTGEARLGPTWCDTH